MATSDDIKKRALELSEKTDSNSISPKEVGGIMHDLASLGENAIRNGGTLGIRKVYTSIAEMEADKNPKDLWGNPLKKGNLVVIYDGTTTGVDNNKIYAYMNPGWQLATHLDAGYATREELTELGSKLSFPTELIGYVNASNRIEPLFNWRYTSKLDLNVVEIQFPIEINMNPLVNTFVYYNVNGDVVGSYGLKESSVEVFNEFPNKPDNTRYVVLSYSEKNTIPYVIKASEADNKIKSYKDIQSKTSFRLNLPYKSYVNNKGVYVEFEYFRSSGYLPIELIASMSGNYVESLVAYSIAFFDKNKSFIGGSELADKVIKSADNLIIPNDAVYMVVSQGTSVIDNYSMDISFTHEVTTLNMYENLHKDVKALQDDTLGLKTRTSFRLSLPLKQYVNVNGDIVSHKDFNNSGFIPINMIATISGEYVTSTATYSVAFFNKEKMFVGGSELLNKEIRNISELSIPSDAAYIMISQGNTVIGDYDLYIMLRYNATPLEWFEELSKSLGRTEVSDVVVGDGFDEFNRAKYDAYKSNQYWGFNNNVVGKVSKVSVYVPSGNTNNLYLCEKGVEPYFIASFVNDSDESVWISSDVVVELTEGKYLCVQNTEGSNILVTNCMDSQLGSTLVFTGDTITSTSKNWGIPIKIELSEKETRTVVQENYNRISEIEKKIGEGTSVEPHDTLAFIPIFGQSIAIGADAKPPISTSALDGVYKVKLDSTGVVVLSAYKESSVETSCYGMAEKLKELYGGRLPWILVTGAYGYGGRTIQQLINGTSNDTEPYHYERLKIAARALKSYCDENGLKMTVPAWCWIQGESDIIVKTADYKQQLLDIHNDWQSFCKELTGQTDDVKMICYQTASFGRSVNYDVFPYNLDIPKVVLGQYELCKEDSRFVMSAPLYFNEHGPANIHLFAQDQKTLGGYEGKSLYRALIDSSYKNIYVKSHSVDGNVITLDIHVPCPPLVVDDNFVNHVDNAGFSVVKSDNTDIIEKVNVVYDKIIITCSESPIGCKLRYGATSQFSLYMSNVDGDDYTQSEHATTISSPDRMVGPRGNIHDSDNCVIGVANQIRALYNLMPYIQIDL